MNINIKPYNLSYVFEHDHVLLNTNNHPYSDESPMPPDYQQIINKTHACNWIYRFHPHVQTINLDLQDIQWIKQAHDIGTCTGRFPQIYNEELDDVCSKYTVPESTNGWFVRSDSASLKHGYYGKGPYFTMREIIISMATGRVGHLCFSIDSDTTLYLLPWKDLDEQKELRVFVYNNKITCISQQYIHGVNQWLNKCSESEITLIIKNVCIYFEKHIQENLLDIVDYVMDLAITDVGCYFIEINSFGACYAAGSALFHWLNDKELLYGQKEYIEFRYVHDI